MRGIVVKPKPCCGDSSCLGKVVEVAENLETGVGVLRCTHCNSKYLDHAKNYYSVGDGSVIQKYRVRILPDDLGDELITETSEEQTA